MASEGRTLRPPSGDMVNLIPATYSPATGDAVRGTYLPAGWMSQAAFASYDPNYQPVLTGQLPLPENTVLTVSQLTYAVNSLSLQAPVGASSGTTTPNISGGTIILDAGEEAGKTIAPTLISVADIESANLTPAQQTALAQADVAGDALLVGTNSQGQTETYSLGQIPGNVIPTAIQVSITRTLYVNAGDSVGDALNVNAPSGINIVQTSGNLQVGDVISAQWRCSS